jgi:hypothetical protein
LCLIQQATYSTNSQVGVYFVTERGIELLHSPLPPAHIAILDIDSGQPT